MPTGTFRAKVAFMPHPIDRALAEAVGQAISWLKEQGWSTREIAARFDVSNPTVIRWEKGTRTPALYQLPLLDELVGETRGYVLRTADYVRDPQPGDVLTAIATDPHLDQKGRASVRQVYGVFRKRWEASNTASAQPDAV